MALDATCETCGRPAWRVWNGVWLCKPGWMLKAYTTVITCRAIWEERDDREALQSLAELEQARDAG